MNTTRKEIRMLTDDILEYTFKEVNKKLEASKKAFKIEIQSELKKHREEIKIINNKILERLVVDILKAINK